jgi:lipooligosaccharide transport system permease protein
LTKLDDSSTRFALPQLTSKVWKVWQRNFDVFLKTVRTNFFPSLLEPILYLLALGLGLGGFIQPIDGVPYINFIAPALVSISIMNGAFFECTFASFVRMYFQKTFDAIIATPVSVEEVIAGEILWGATRATINSTTVLVVIAAFGLVSGPLFLLVPLFAFLCGLMFASIAMCFTAIAPNIDFFNYPSFLFVTPMFLLSGTFFPLSQLPPLVQMLAQIFLPLTHVVNVVRGVVLDRLDFFLMFSVLWIVIVTLFFFLLSISLMKKRLIK